MTEERKWKGTNTFLTKCLKFNLIKNSKLPGNEWNKSNKNNFNCDSYKLGNWGLVCGKANNCIGLDLDIYSWNDENPFYEFIGTKDIYKWAKAQNTLCIKTTSDGLHLIYKLNDNPLKNINDNKLNIDIKGEGGYLVGAGSIVKSKITNEWGEYTIYNNKPLTEMPKELIEWLLTNLSYAKNKKTTKKYKTQSNQDLSLNDDVSNYNFNFTDKELTNILDNLPEEYITKHGYWLNTASAMKAINRVEFFLDYCMKHKNTRCQVKNDEFYNTNVKLINNIKDTETFKMSNMLIKILNTTKLENANHMLAYKKYKPIIQSTFTNDNITYIDIDKLGKGLTINENKNYVIKSDTGTGKTTLFKKYIADNEINNVISTVSRISLADEQYVQFNEEGIEIHNYRYFKGRFNTGVSVIITIDSIIRLAQINDLSQYVVFLDEFNSLMEYLMTCPNLKRNRCIVFKMLLKILRECKQIICVDADINSNSLKILDFCNVKYDFVINKYLHNKSSGDKPVSSKEIFTFDSFIEELQKLNEAMVCCDSKIDAETIFKKVIEYKFKQHNIDINVIKENGEISTEDSDGNKTLNKYEKRVVYIKGCSICLITSDTDEMINLDKYDFVIFSPKIVYGLDSIKKRPVFGHYKEHTISPKAMIQQIARCRNIEYLRYIFYKKVCIEDKYNTLKDVEAETKDLLELSTFELICDKEELKLYIDMLNTIIYNNDAYNTNKFCHFKMLLEERGFKDEEKYLKANNVFDICEANKETRLEKYENFDTYDSHNNKINEYLKLPIHEIKKYKDLFLEPNMLERHFTIQQFFFKGLVDWDKNISEMSGFFNDKLHSSPNKLKYITRLMKELNLTTRNNINADIGLSSKTVSEKYYNEYKLLFRNRTKETIDLTDKHECRKFLFKLYSNQFGREICKSKRINKKTETIYLFNNEYFDKHRDILLHKYPFINRDKLDFTYGNEKSLYNRKSPEYLKFKVLQQLKDCERWIIKKHVNKN